MKPIAAHLVALLAAPLLAGCAGSNTDPAGPDPSGKPPLDASRGAIAGLVIDDRYRPVPQALVLLTPVGLTATTDELGQFQVLSLEPGVYVAQAQAPDHEAAPKPVDVVGGQYTDLEVMARRVFSENGGIITTEFSAFIPCSVNDVENSYNVNCVADLSGDSFRGGFTSAKLNKSLPWTVLVSEVLVNQDGNFAFQVREDDGSTAGGERYAVGMIQAGNYKKLVNERGVINTEDNAQKSNVPFNGTKPFNDLPGRRAPVRLPGRGRHLVWRWRDRCLHVPSLRRRGHVWLEG